MTSHHASELDLENFGLTIWDLDREFITGGLHDEKTATLRRILEILRKAYCGKARSASSIAISRARTKRNGSGGRCASILSIPNRSTRSSKKSCCKS
jgi:hypothetical protein